MLGEYLVNCQVTTDDICQTLSFLHYGVICTLSRVWSLLTLTTNTRNWSDKAGTYSIYYENADCSDWQGMFLSRGSHLHAFTNRGKGPESLWSAGGQKEEFRDKNVLVFVSWDLLMEREEEDICWRWAVNNNKEDQVSVGIDFFLCLETILSLSLYNRSVFITCFV